MTKVTNPDTNPGGDANSMNIDTGQFRALREEVTALTQQVEQLHRQAGIFRAIGDLIAGPGGAGTLGAGMAVVEHAFLAGQASIAGGWSGQARRPRHLQAVRDDTA